MMAFHFLEDNPVIIWFIMLGLLITVVPMGAALYRRLRDVPPKQRVAGPRASRFLGTQMDLAILVLGLLVAVVIISWLTGLLA